MEYFPLFAVIVSILCAAAGVIIAVHTVKDANDRQAKADARKAELKRNYNQCKYAGHTLAAEFDGLCLGGIYCEEGCDI